MKNSVGNILLTGFRATGKSTVGRLLAQRLGLHYMDMDIELSARLGGSVAEIVATRGWGFFRAAEARLLEDIATLRGYVIASGGGAVEHQKQWEALRLCCCVLWLDADVATINARIQADPLSLQQRPKLSGQSGSQPESTQAILERRRPLYRLGSDLRLDVGENSPEQLVMTALAWLESQESGKGFFQQEPLAKK